MLFFAAVKLAAGLAVLTVGGWLMVRSATAIALLANVSTTVVGLTVVAMGTSLPELAVSVGAAFTGSTEMAYGNIVGSNIFNLAIVLPVAAFFMPIPVGGATFRFEYPIMFVATAAMVSFGLNGMVGRPEGLVLTVGLVAFIVSTVWTSGNRRLSEEDKDFETGVERAASLKANSKHAWATNITLVLLGGIALTIGAKFMVDGAVTFADRMNIPERIIGLTILAIGTSLPELATTITAAIHKETGLVLSNVIGSNIFNILAILGVTASAFPVTVSPQAMGYDNIWMLAFSVLLLPLMMTKKQVGRVDATIMIVLFVVYSIVLLA